MIARHSWGKIWEKRPRLSELDETLHDYNKRIPEVLLPEPPNVEDFLNTIRQTKNSATGPDGIPFLAYRTTADNLAQSAKITRERRVATT